jgi:class 3 adenylate cyclase
VTTEGDSFTIAFHDAFDAVCWSLAMQQAMLEAGEGLVTVFVLRKQQQHFVPPLFCGRLFEGVLVW